METKSKYKERLRKALLVLAASLLLPLSWHWQTARADDLKWRGVVESMPMDGFEGEWEVSGRTFIANGSTQIKQENGPLQVGACAEVEYMAAEEVDIAVKIVSKEAGECIEDATPEASGTPQETSTPASTQTPQPSETPAPTPDDDDDDGDDGDQNGDDDDAETKRYGIIDVTPADGLIGTWQIDGEPYVTTSDTEFDPEHGGFTAGACVEIEYDASTTPPTIWEMETEHDYKCADAPKDDDEDTDDDKEDLPEGKMYGVIQSFPPDLIGEWKIGGMTFTADSSTEFDQDDGEFAEGVTVKVKFFTDADDVNYATEIEVIYGNKEDDDDDDDDESEDEYAGAEGKAYGLIETFPPDLIGQWVVSGITYTASAETEFEQDDGAFAVGARVKIEYIVDAQNDRRATEIETTDDDGDIEEDEHYKLVGFVQEMPQNGFIGEWQIGNTRFIADLSTEFDEDDAVLAVGSFVEAEYAITPAGNLLHELEARVPPGGGENNRVGQIQSMGDDGIVAASVHAATWIIDGTSYRVTPATKLNDAGGALTIGTTVDVNSYTATDGMETATRIQNVSLERSIYLPVTLR
jgi:hypothetical protein